MLPTADEDDRMELEVICDDVYVVQPPTNFHRFHRFRDDDDDDGVVLFDDPSLLHSVVLGAPTTAVGKQFPPEVKTVQSPSSDYFSDGYWDDDAWLRLTVVERLEFKTNHDEDASLPYAESSGFAKPVANDDAISSEPKAMRCSSAPETGVRSVGESKLFGHSSSIAPEAFTCSCIVIPGVLARSSFDAPEIAVDLVAEASHDDLWSLQMTTYHKMRQLNANVKDHLRRLLLIDTVLTKIERCLDEDDAKDDIKYCEHLDRLNRDGHFVIVM